MSIKFNNTEIPTTKGNIKYNGTELTEVKFNGTSVWKVLSDPIYIIKDGATQTICTNPTISYNGHTARSGRIQLGTADYVYGVYAHTNGSSGNWYVRTGNVQTNGASTLDLSFDLLLSGLGSSGMTVKVYNGSTEIASKSFTSSEYQKNFTYNSINISGYSSISIELIGPSISSSSNGWVGLGIRNAVMK